MLDTSLEKLNQFTSMILSEAKTESGTVYEEIERKSQEALDAAEDKALAEAFRFIKSEIAKINVENGRLLSKAVMDNKRALYLRREAMSEEVLDQAHLKLREYVNTEAYQTQIKKTGYTKKLFPLITIQIMLYRIAPADISVGFVPLLSV